MSPDRVRRPAFAAGGTGDAPRIEPVQRPAYRNDPPIRRRNAQEANPCPETVQEPG